MIPIYRSPLSPFDLVCLAICLVMALLVLPSCGQAKAKEGTAQDAAVGAESRASDLHADADKAKVEAAKAEAKATNAQEIAQVAADAAAKTPTPQMIEAAAAARVAAVQAGADARIARAVADAMAAQAIKAQGDADEAIQRAAVEREQEAAATEKRRLAWISGIAIAGAIGVGFFLSWSHFPPALAVGAPGAVIAAALALSAWSVISPLVSLVIGVAFLLAVIGGLVYLVVVVLREWGYVAGQLGLINAAEKAMQDEASKARQNPLVAWVLDHLLKLHLPAAPAAIATTPKT